MENVKWEYVLVSRPNAYDIKDVLSSYGNDGWELCGIDYGCLIFKKKID